jgi:hypothetical protein
MYAFLRTGLSDWQNRTYICATISAPALQIQAQNCEIDEKPIQLGGGSMKPAKIILLLLLIPIFLGLLIPGCSDKSFTTTGSEVYQNASPTAYLPLEKGLRVSYVILEPETRYYDIEVTNEVNIAGNSGYAIRQTDRNSGRINTFYRYEKDNAIFESGSTGYLGERILESPFVAGNTWDRLDRNTSDDNDGNINDGIILDGYDFGGGDYGWPGNTWKVKPGEDYTTMRIVGFETVEALNGVSYGHCLKVGWQTAESTWSYYWYAAGIGLVKFEQNYSSVASSNNRTVGVMTDYQTVEY